jgi:hypothetical protein
MMTGRSHGAERSHTAGNRTVDPVEHAADRCARGIPGAFADNRIGVERATPSTGDVLDLLDVSSVMGEPQFIDRGVSTLEMLQRVK